MRFPKSSESWAHVLQQSNQEKCDSTRYSARRRSSLLKPKFITLHEIILYPTMAKTHLVELLTELSEMNIKNTVNCTSPVLYRSISIPVSSYVYVSLIQFIDIIHFIFHYCHKNKNHRKIFKQLLLLPVTYCIINDCVFWWFLKHVL